MENVTQNQSSPSSCSAALLQGFCSFPSLFATWCWGAPVQSSGMGWLSTGPVLSCPPRRATQTVPGGTTNCHLNWRGVCQWFKSHHCVHAFLRGREWVERGWQSMGEVSISWEIWLKIVLLFQDLPAADMSTPLYFICVCKSYRKKRYIMFLKWHLQTVGKKGEGTWWGVTRAAAGSERPGASCRGMAAPQGTNLTRQADESVCQGGW